MHSPASPAQPATSPMPPIAASAGPTADSEITWLLHRAAQRMHAVTAAQADKHGLQLRDYIVLSALAKAPGLTQGELGKALGLDKSTLMSQLDRLERLGLVVRRVDRRDRRARIPEITKAGNALRAQVASACDTAEAAALNAFSPDDVQRFRQMLSEIIGDSQDRGSCL